MTIKELENRTGMTRANIRFYEGEDLLHPKRLDNGYRDYSEEDALTLEKIKLLRQLQLDIDTIRKVQQGTLTLEQALFTQLTRLEGDKAIIQRAAEVCRELEASGVEYAALEPQPWLTRLEPSPAQPALSAPPPRPVRPEVDDTPRACYCPWQRFFARMLDMTLYLILFDGALFAARVYDIVAAHGILAWVMQLLALGFTLAVEPLWLHFWGWTPGKWVFGLKLRNEQGEKLTLAQGFQRSGVIIWEGYGLTLPGYSLWRFWKCREMSLEGRDCHWDGQEGHRYTKEERRFSGWIFAGVQAVYIAVLAVGLLYVRTPVNRGPLTVEQFAQNYNYYYDYFHIGTEYVGQSTMDEAGRWVEQETSGGTVVSNEIFNGIPVRGEVAWLQPEFTVENGRVTAVTLRWVSDRTYAFSSGVREMLAMLALSGSGEGMGLFSYDLAGWVQAAQEENLFTQWRDVETEYRWLHISQHIESSGYDEDGSFLIARDGETQHCEKTVTISLIQ